MDHETLILRAVSLILELDEDQLAYLLAHYKD